MSEQFAHQQNNSKEIEQQNKFNEKGEKYYENIKISRQFCSDILRVRL